MFSDFQQSYLPTLVEGWVEVMLAAQSRVAETRLLAQLDALSIASTSAAQLSATRGLLDVVSRVTEQYESTFRQPEGAEWLAIVPGWLGNYLGTDISRQSVAEPFDTLSVGDSDITSWFSQRANVRVVESPERQPLAALTTGAVAAWPATVKINLVPSGSAVFPDGGVLDLGIVRDSTLVAQNKAELFAESFEAVAVLGLQPVTLTATLCPSGSAVGPTTASGLCA